MFRFAGTRLGVSYRSAITHKISGTARYEKPSLPDALNAITRSPATTDGNVTADLRLPAVATVSVYHQLNKEWALMGDVSHSTWGRFNEIRIRFANGAADSVSPQNYKNTTRVAFGASFQATPKLTLRSGFSFDPSPVRDELRSPLVPDNDRKWAAFGATFKPSSDMTVDLSYAHLFVNEPSSSLTVSGAGSLRGRYNSVSANIVTVQLNRTF
jgi:long-chain fatty acid transport protein